MRKECKIVPLSNETLSDAISLVVKIFPYKPDQKNAKISLTKSLSEAKCDREYWICKTLEGKVVGIIGLYCDRRDKSTFWIGWFGVHPEYRRRGIGSRLLKHAEKEAKRRDAEILKVYSSFHKNELTSHALYEKHGYIRTHINKKADRICFSKELKNDTISERSLQMEQETIYDIYWEGPFDWREKDSHLTKNHVLYQIYGLHHQYGSDVLLYIGSTSNIINRLREHKVWVLDEWSNVTVRIGSLGKFISWKNWENGGRYPRADEKLVKNIEALLIYAHQPAYNRANKEQAEKAKGIRIFNSGKSGSLFPEVSYKYFLGD